MMHAMAMERARMAMPGMGAPGMGSGTVGTAGAMPAGMNMMMVPRCTVTMEKCAGGMMITCTCDGKTACGMMQNLCTMLAGGMCSCCTIWSAVAA